MGLIPASFSSDFPVSSPVMIVVNQKKKKDAKRRTKRSRCNTVYYVTNLSSAGKSCFLSSSYPLDKIGKLALC